MTSSERMSIGKKNSLKELKNDEYWDTIYTTNDTNSK